MVSIQDKRRSSIQITRTRTQTNIEYTTEKREERREREQETQVEQKVILLSISTTRIILSACVYRGVRVYVCVDGCSYARERGSRSIHIQIYVYFVERNTEKKNKKIKKKKKKRENQHKPEEEEERRRNKKKKKIMGNYTK